jgi:formylglycine-generating enzyme required for sulfatase activity
VDVYAVSLPGVTPARSVTWFQAAAAARNSGKRLPTNQEWQAAALGTPDPGFDDGSTTCATATSLSATGSRSDCISDVGAFDMVGNLHEWVADWVPRSPDCSNNWGAFSDDVQCLVGAAPSGPPGALIRGGSFYDGAWGGVFFVSGNLGPEAGFDSVGFRCAH